MEEKKISNSLRFKDLIQPFLEYKKDYVRATTLAAYTDIYDNHLIPHFGEYTALKQEDVDDFIFLKGEEGSSRKSLENYAGALKTLFKWVNVKGIFPPLVFKANYPFDATEKQKIIPFTTEESKMFANYCEENFNFIRLALYTTLFTGLRSGEICGLQFKDIDVTRGILSVNKTAIVVNVPKRLREKDEPSSKLVISEPKTKGSVREIPLAKQALRYYKALFGIVNPEYYVVTNSEKPAYPNMLRHELNKITESISIRKIRLHDLRHTFATRCIAVGIDHKTVSVLLGHSSVDITLKTYTHVDDDDKTLAINKLSKKMSWD